MHDEDADVILAIKKGETGMKKVFLDNLGNPDGVLDEMAEAEAVKMCVLITLQGGDKCSKSEAKDDREQQTMEPHFRSHVVQKLVTKVEKFENVCRQIAVLRITAAEVSEVCNANSDAKVHFGGCP